MALPVFPNIEQPQIPEAANNSFNEDFADSTISTTTTAKYKITRPGASRMPGSWDYAWNALSEADYALMIAFWKQVNGTAGMFLWTEPISGQQKTVRFTTKGKWQQKHTGWTGSLSFEEV